MSSGETREPRFRLRHATSLARRTLELLHKVQRDTYLPHQSYDFLFFCSDADRSETILGLGFSRVLDPVRIRFEREGFTVFSLAYPGSVLVGDLGFGSPASFTRTYVWQTLKAPFFRLVHRTLRKLRATSKSAPQTVVEAQTEVYSAILSRLRPRAVLCIDAHEPLCVAASRLGIPVYEVLHARGYQEIYPGWTNRRRNALPSAAISYDHESTETFTALLPVIQVNPEFLNERPDSGSWIEAAPPPAAVGFQRRVLFTTQWGYAGDDPRYTGQIPNGIIPEEMLETIFCEKDVFFFVRLHPVIKRSKRPLHRRLIKKIAKTLEGLDHVDIAWASEQPFQVVIQNSTSHVTFSSTSVFDSADYGVRSLILDPLFRSGGVNGNVFQGLREAGFIDLASTKEEITSWIHSDHSKLAPASSIQERLSSKMLLTESGSRQ